MPRKFKDISQEEFGHAFDLALLETYGPEVLVEKPPVLRPLGDRVVLWPEVAPNQVGHVHLPDNAKKVPRKGYVMAVGPGPLQKDGTRRLLPLVVGDKVAYERYAGVTVVVDGYELTVVKFDQVMAVLDES